ncbi:MAG: hypothetical protein ACW96M_03710 [Candidatus Thorarchaeota archaeon]|jgi:hypothetical protein
MSNANRTVNVWINSQEVRKGVLRIREDDLVIIMKSGEVISGKNSTNVLYSVVDDPRLSRFKILFEPILVTKHHYAADIGHVIEDIFPPSSGGFYGRLRAGKNEAVFVIQDISNDKRMWLIIGDPQTGSILETQTIQPYEAETLKLIDDKEIFDLWNRHIWSDKKEFLKKEILGILSEPSPSWKMISKLVDEVAIADLKRGKTVRETLTQLVPDSFPEHIREQLMAFLASVMMDRIGADEVMDVSSYVHAAPMFSAFLQGHFRCIVDNVKWPSYLEIIIQSSRGQLEQPKRTLSEITDDSWRFLWHKMIESFPNWFGNAIVTAQKLNESTKSLLRLPVTKSQATKSSKLRKKRLAAITYGLKIRGHVNPHAIGLTELVYIGAAYRWPHRHMRFITRLGMVSDNPPHLQVMNLPPSSAERVMRALPQSIKISWSNRIVNLSLYNTEKKKWEIPVDKILESVHKRSSKRRVIRRFGNADSPKPYRISSDDAQVLGLVSGGINLDNFEIPGYFRFWDLSRKQVSSSISKMKTKGILQIIHDVDDDRLVSLASIIQGNSKNVSSFVDSLLTNTPTSLAMLNDQFDRAVVISRFPDDMAYDLVSKINHLGIRQDLVIRCMRPRAYRDFTSTLYHRLLREDGSWDDDVSAFLSQARSKRRELSESNA